VTKETGDANRLALVAKMQYSSEGERRKEIIMRIKRNCILIAGAVLTVVAGLLPSVAVARADDAKSVTGEVVDLMCYLDHGAKGDKHAGCAEKCIKSGGPVGLLTKDDQLYLVIGDHEPMNGTLAPHAGKTVTLTGKVVERNGVKMIENAKLEK
jgi:hypothetical protein